MIGQINVARFAKDRLRTLPFKDRILVRFATGVVTLGHELGGTMLNAVNITERHLYCHPEDGHTNAGIETGDFGGQREFQHIIDMPMRNAQQDPGILKLNV